MINQAVEPGTDEGWGVIEAAVSCARQQLDAGLLSAYAIGSLAHGGFRRAVSDVDLALLTDDQPARDMSKLVERIIDHVVSTGHVLEARLSIFYAPWVSFPRPSRGARFPPIDRYDLMRFGVLVYGEDMRARYGRVPDADEIRAQAVESALRRITSAQLSVDLRELEQADVTVHDATKIVLWPVRLQHVCDTAQATGNAAAVHHYLDLPGARHSSLVQDALHWRDLPVIEDPASALTRISAEIHDLNVEVFQRVAAHPHTPRRSEIDQRCRELAA